MKFLIITHVPHCFEQNKYFAYAPYVREMNIWGKYVEELVIVAPLSKYPKTAIDCFYDHKNIQFIAIENFDFLNARNSFDAMVKFPKIVWTIYKAMQDCDHIHLRCPGNVGLLGCFVQILFPKKLKTAKYAGNWDPNSLQPWTYKLQSWIVSTTFLTKNIQVLVYGNWKNATLNIKSFFTATYSEQEIQPLLTYKEITTFQFVFVGALVKGKNPLYAIQLMEQLIIKGYSVSLKLYGEGDERTILEHYIRYQKLEYCIFLEGNKNKENIKQAYQDSHYVILPSASEGWPKAIAEGMFWGSVPLATSVSCLPFMLDYGKRGLLLTMNLAEDCKIVQAILDNKILYDTMQQEGANWSRHYTTELFEQEIKKLLS